MIDKLLQERIAARAYSIYEWRIANNIPGSAADDWMEAEGEIIPDRRMITGCPKCGFTLLARSDGEMFCLKTTCDWRIKAKRLCDKDKPDFKEIRKEWGIEG